MKKILQGQIGQNSQFQFCLDMWSLRQLIHCNQAQTLNVDSRYFTWLD